MPDATAVLDDPTITPIVLFMHICDQRRGYVVRFATEAQALAYCQARTSTHAIHEDQDEPIDFGTADEPRNVELYDFLYPTCPHGLSESNCNGPQHYWFDEEEQGRGMRNSW